MTQPFRRYCFILAERLGMTVKRLLKESSSAEISEWMAFDLHSTEEFKTRYEKEKQQQSSAYRADQLRRLFGGVKDG